jgi:hypothetical protein
MSKRGRRHHGPFLSPAGPRRYAVRVALKGQSDERGMVAASSAEAIHKYLLRLFGEEMTDFKINERWNGIRKKR